MFPGVTKVPCFLEALKPPKSTPLKPLVCFPSLFCCLSSEQKNARHLSNFLQGHGTGVTTCGNKNGSLKTIGGNYIYSFFLFSYYVYIYLSLSVCLSIYLYICVCLNVLTFIFFPLCCLTGVFLPCAVSRCL